MARRKSTAGIALPWEGRGPWLARLAEGPRWRIALVALGGAAAAWWAYALHAETERRRDTELAVAETQRAVASFRSDVGRCPRSLDELVHPARARRRYLRDVPRDGWGRTLYVRCPARFDPNGADVVSAGPDGDFFDDDNVR